MRKMLRVCAVTGLIFAAGGGSALAGGAISPEEVSNAQKQWGECIVTIGKVASDQAAAKAAASACIDTLYAYEQGGVLFKPTKAAADQFRQSKDEAISYFVTGIVPEDHGFALQPWTNVRFENAQTITDADSALAMGNYYFTDGKTGKEVKVEYTFGYKKDDQNKVRINLHHSSLPFQPAH